MSKKPHIDENTSAAVGAIRRAVAIARTNDKIARRYAWEGDPQAFAFRMAADSVRRAIRQAMQSDKP
jgi:hypothetical protein